MQDVPSEMNAHAAPVAPKTRTRTSASPCALVKRFGPASIWVVVIAGIFIAGVLAPSASAQRFLVDDPLWEDPDRLDMPVPAPQTGAESVRFLTNTFAESRGTDGPAININTLGEVPHSSWYENRHYAHRMSRRALQEGPSQGHPPPQRPWQVVDVSSVQPVLVAEIRDARGVSYTLRLDPPGHAAMSTGAALVANRAYYALGYNVPSMHPVTFGPGDLRGDSVSAADESRFWDALEAAPTVAPGTYRAAAYRIPETIVRPLGPFRFSGTRPDDGNDVFPHQRRRELRGLHVAAAWLNHTGIRASRTLDVAVQVDNRTFVRHYILDTFEALGSARGGPKEPWMGREYLVEVNPVLLRMGTLGLSGGDWVNLEYPDVAAVGRFGARQFEPTRWRPEHPNPAFSQRDSADTFWMARQIAAFTDSEIRSLVSAAAYPERETEDYITTVLSQRRDSIATAYLGYGGGLDRFYVSDGALHFADLITKYRSQNAPLLRTVRWHRFSNEQNRATDDLGFFPVADTVVPIPGGNAPYLRARIATPGKGHTDVYLRRRTGAHSPQATRYEVVGMERANPPEAAVEARNGSAQQQ